MPRRATHLPAGRLRSRSAPTASSRRALRHRRKLALNVIETDEWLYVQDAEGRTYYYHAVTMETSWTDPRVVVEEAPKPERQQLHALHVFPSLVDRDALSQILHSEDAMDEAQTEQALLGRRERSR